MNIDFVTSTSRCPGPGETLTANSLTVSAGGKGANQAAACGRAAFTSKSSQDVVVSMVGAVGAGDVYYSSLLKPALEESGVNTRSIEESIDTSTGSATIIIEEDFGGENRILVVPGANHAGMMADTARIVSAVNEHQASPGVIVLQGEIPRKTTLGLLEYFNGCDSIHVVFNPAPVFSKGIPLNALEHTSVLIMNETEARQMSMSISSPSNLDQPPELDSLKPEEIAPRFHDLAHVQIVLITLGEIGVYFSTRSGHRGAVVAVPVVNVVDTTAAGDTFVGYFSTALCRFLARNPLLDDFGSGIENVVSQANAAVGQCVQCPGAMRSVPFAFELG